MINYIKINNFAIVDNLELEFGRGLTAISGETGAGKSIMIDALGLVLGDRAESSLVRHGSKRAEILASFSLDENDRARQWLAEHELDSDHECILRRTIKSDGPSRAFINGTPVTVSHLRELGQILINIHSQHEHQALLKTDTHRALLDDFAGEKDRLTELGKYWREWQAARKQYKSLSQTVTEDSARIDLLKYQVEELASADLQENELESLELEHKRLASADTLMESTRKAVFRLTEGEDSSALDLLHSACNDLQDNARDDSQLASVLEMLSSAIIQVEESAQQLNHYLDNVEEDPEKLRQTEQRLGLLYELARKHKVPVAGLYPHFQSLSEELDIIENKDESLATLEKQASQLEKKYLKIAKAISASRKKAATKLGDSISREISRLGMDKGKLSVNVDTLPLEKATEKGIDHVEFNVALNPGQPFKPLAKVASGGELSRISLAIQVICANTSATPTLIFDEVDVGVGGATGEIVGKLLRKLGENTQVICVTHLPQVAAQGNQHLSVSKLSSRNSTCTRIRLLDPQQRVDEIARMLGGVDITRNTLAHAEEMLQTG